MSNNAWTNWLPNIRQATIGEPVPNTDPGRFAHKKKGAPINKKKG